MRRAFDKTLSYLVKLRYTVPELPSKKWQPRVAKMSTSIRSGRFISAPVYWKNKKEDGTEDGYCGQAFTTITKAEVESLENLPKDANGNIYGSNLYPITGDDMVGLNSDSVQASSRGLNNTRRVIAAELRELKATNLYGNIIKLSAYHNKNYVCNYEYNDEGSDASVPVVSVGDASGGVPFQRSLCGSFQAIPHLPTLLSTVSSGKVASDGLNDYTKKVDGIWKKEIRRALGQSRKLNVGNLLIHCVHQLIKPLSLAIILLASVVFTLYRRSNRMQREV
ncbi:MAG: hypothetical protein SP4CHLAM5_00430 [Chlamydiia bacterium]|nr:hypothetical protein [Chlamydiia bacterium]